MNWNSQHEIRQSFKTKPGEIKKPGKIPVKKMMNELRKEFGSWAKVIFFEKVSIRKNKRIRKAYKVK